MHLLGGRTQASSRTTFAYTPAAVWRYFLVAHQRYFGEFFLVNQRLTRNPTLSAMYQGPVAIQTIAPGLFLCARVGKFSAPTQLAQRVGQGAIAGLAGGALKKGL